MSVPASIPARSASSAPPSVHDDRRAGHAQTDDEVAGRGARCFAISSLKMNCSIWLMPAPPYSFGQAGAIQPRSASCLNQL